MQLLQLMKIFLLFFCIVSLVCFSQEGHYPSNPIVWDGQFSDEYSLCVMDKDYRLAAFGNLLHNIPHGNWIYFREEGIVKEKGAYKKGLRHGEWISYDVHGNVQSKGKYRKGKLHGEWLLYDKVLFYKNGIQIK